MGSFDKRLKIIIIFTLALLLIPISAFICIHGSINFDEAYFLQAPTSLVKQGTYSTTFDGGQNFDPGFSTGPTVLLPIGVIFKLFGIGIIQARLTMLVYFLLMVAMTFRVSETLFGSTSAFLSLVMILCLPDMFFLPLKVFGEIPAILFFITGCWFFIKDRPFLSGIFIGLAILTKFLFILSLPAMLFLFLIEFLSYKGHKKPVLVYYVKGLIGLLLPILVWEAVRFISLGPSEYQSNVAKFFQMVAVSSGTQEVFSLPILLERIAIFGSPYPWIPSLIVLTLFLGAIIFSLFSNNEFKKSGEGDRSSRARLFLLIFSLIYIFWWMFWKHLEWWRYLFPGYIILIVVVGDIFATLIRRIATSFFSSPGHSRAGLIIRSTAGIFAILVLLTPLFIEPVHAQGLRIKSYLFDDELSVQYRVADEISSIERAGGRIAYWTWWQAPEISFLSQSRFMDIYKVETRQELDAEAINEKRIYVLITPTQTKVSPEAWVAESIYCGKLVYELNGYQLFEYVPEYYKIYREFIDQVDVGSITNAYTLLGQEYLIDHHAKGFYSNGWIGRKASLWLRNDSSYTTLTIEGTTTLEFIKKQRNSVKVYLMGLFLGEEKITDNNNFKFEFQLPVWAKSFKALKIDLESSKIFTQPSLGSAGGDQEVSILISRVELH